MKAITTEYNGYKFRSRLEARWAIFFDNAGIKYEYEPEGYELDNGMKYLPDFYLPDFNVYVEVKGQWNGWGEDIKKIISFLNEPTPFKGILFLTEIPFAKSVNKTSVFWFPFFFYDQLNGASFTRVLFREFADRKVELLYKYPMTDWHRMSVKNYYFTDKYEFYKVIPDTEIHILSDGCEKEYPFKVSDANYTPVLDNAYITAKQAKFEY